jgi:MFS family permease
MVDALDTPARQALTLDLVDDPVDLANAIALNSSCFNTARLLGPAIGGLLLVKFTAGVCFAIDGASYLAVIAGLLMMRLKPRPRPAGNHNVLHDLWEGVRYTFGFAPLRAILMLVGTTAFTGAAFSTLMPLFAAGMENGPHSAATFGLLMAGIGAGALGGAIYLASRRTIVGLGRVMCYAALLLGISISLFTLTHNFYLGLLLAACGGFGMVTHFASGNTMLQTITEDTMRGRVMSFFSMMVIGSSPFGALLAGWLADRLQRPGLVVQIYAVVMIAGAVWFFRALPKIRTLVRPIYVKRGIIPEVAVGLAMDEREEG